jgi:hypothetical protein
MNLRLDLPLTLAAAIGFGSVACTQEKPAVYASSASQGTYALSYPDSMTGARTEIATVEAQIQTAKTEFVKYPDALAKPSWPDVMSVYAAADEDGKSSGYGAEVERSEVIARFYVDEKDELNRRVAGAAAHAVKQKECDVEVYGPTSYALGKAFEERLRERLRSRSEAHRYLDEHEAQLGKKNRPKLEDQIDAIARVSYLAHVAMPRLRDRLADGVSEGSAVSKTLDRLAEDAHRKAEDPSLPKEERTKAASREQSALNSKKKLEPELAESKRLAEEMEARADAARKTYEEAFDVLEKEVDKRADSGG